eukprot:NODE_3264_length_436_cov_20.323625_g3214_i0.p3 GENE.NODE_3264_length_436_cov_20.323625_g3214_i0~~NODE_3264_length_436_cov_20.323625_g3214_i0.p3  ORF type:complete len:144 (-),score=47.01 NODE_3264_length_436_cov_20.323625_g3214_i0:3-389(-)
MYASGRDGWCDNDLDGPRENLHPLFEKIIEHVPAPKVVTEGNKEKPFSMLISLLDRDNFVGRILTGRVETGRVKVGDPIHALSRDSKVIETGRISKLLAFRGLERVPVEEAEAGDIVAIAGLTPCTLR